MDVEIIGIPNADSAYEFVVLTHLKCNIVELSCTAGELLLLPLLAPSLEHAPICPLLVSSTGTNSVRSSS